MEITEKELSKLKQLDRIEFRQRYEKFKREKTDVGIFSFINTMFVILGFVILFGAIFYVGGNYDVFAQMMLVVKKIVILTTIGATLLLLLDIIYAIKDKNAKKKLIEEYFKIEAK